MRQIKCTSFAAARVPFVRFAVSLPFCYLFSGGGGSPIAGRSPGSRSASRSERSAKAVRDPAEALAATATVPAGPLTLEALLERWEEIVEAVHRSRPTVAALLRGTQPVVGSAEEMVEER